LIFCIVDDSADDKIFAEEDDSDDNIGIIHIITL